MGDSSHYRQPDLSLLNEEHVRRYRETNGEVGHIWSGATGLLLITIGNKSGEARTTSRQGADMPAAIPGIGWE